MQNVTYHVKDVAGLPHTTVDPVHIAARQDALPPVGSAAYAGRKLRGHETKAQTGEKSNINARGYTSENAAKAGALYRGSCLCRVSHGERCQAVSRRDRCTCFLPCFLSLFSSTLRCMAARLPEIARKSELTILLVTCRLGKQRLSALQR